MPLPRGWSRAGGSRWALAITLALAACSPFRARLASLGLAGAPVFDEAHFAQKPLRTYSVALDSDRRPVETVVGRAGRYRIRAGDTLLDVARYYDLGYGEIVDANPGVDPWVPPVGTTVVVPAQWVLPCCTYEGLVLNIPEMRLYFYERRPGTLLVRTYPVGLGRPDRRTPRGRFRIRGKTVNPRWDIPESIREEHIRERGDARASIPGGDPDNPLGKYRLELTVARYSIHGTNVPWGAGMPVSHGCARLYPEDIAQLFPLVAVGAPVEFTYQPVKVGRRREGTFVEAHHDIYGLGRSPYRDALAALKRSGLGDRVDRSTVAAAVKGSHGEPVRLGDPPGGSS
jgi:L,D-transpeptidase ErfK/SrfK